MGHEISRTPQPGPAAAVVAEWVVDSEETVWHLWDTDIVEPCKPHFSRNSITGLHEVDGLTIWAHAGRPQTWARFGDTVRIHTDRTYTVHPAQPRG
jgi:hypothetical protein